MYFNRRGDGKFVAKGQRSAEDVIICRDAHEAIIDRATFDRIQTRFKTMGFTKGEGRPYDGLVFCACGAKAYPVPGGRKGSYTYRYVCSVRQRFGTCPEPPVLYHAVAEALDAAIDETFPVRWPRRTDGQLLPRGLPDDPLRPVRRDIVHRLLALVEPDVQRLLKGSTDVRQRLTVEIEKLERQQARAYNDRLEDPDAVPLKVVADIAERIKSAKAELKTLKATHTDFDIDEAIIELTIPALARAEGELIRLLVSRIVVSAGVVSIVWSEYGESVVNRGKASLSPVIWVKPSLSFDRLRG